MGDYKRYWLQFIQRPHGVFWRETDDHTYAAWEYTFTTNTESKTYHYAAFIPSASDLKKINKSKQTTWGCVNKTIDKELFALWTWAQNPTTITLGDQQHPPSEQQPVHSKAVETSQPQREPLHATQSPITENILPPDIIFQTVNPNGVPLFNLCISVPINSRSNIRSVIHRIRSTPLRNVFLKIRNTAIFDYYVLTTDTNLLNKIGGVRVFDSDDKENKYNFLAIKAISRRFKNLYHKLLESNHKGLWVHVSDDIAFLIDAIPRRVHHNLCRFIEERP